MDKQKVDINKALLLALIDVSILSFGHACNNLLIMTFALVGFTFIILSNPKELFLPIMLFYLPWSKIMKLSPDTFTFYSLVVPVFFIGFLVGQKRERAYFHPNNIILTCVIIIWTLSAKLISGNNIEPSYLLFVMMLIFVPTYLKIFQKDISFTECVTFMAWGTLAACVAAEILMKMPHMVNYINVYVLEQVGLVRLSGFYGDANFYSIHILVAIAGLLIIITQQKGKSVTQSLVVVFVLIFFGLKSVSKMFLIDLVAVLGIWIGVVLTLRGKVMTKLSIILGIAIGVMIVVFSGLFTDEINYYLVRFGMVEDAASLTTGRSDIYSMYLSYFLDNPLSLLFGQGCTHTVPSFGVGAHNTFVEIVYQFGIVGVPLIVGWLAFLFKSVGTRRGFHLNMIQKCLIFIFAIPCFTPWSSLDILSFDEFFYISALFLIGRNYIAENEIT